MTKHLRSVDLLASPVERRLKVGVLTPHNPFNPKSFSGTPYHAFRALMRQTTLDIQLLGAHRPEGFKDRVLKRLGRRRSEPIALRREDVAGLDAVLGLVASDLLETLPQDMPFFHVTDATPGFLEDAYGWDIPDTIHAREERIAARAEACIYSSEIMAARAKCELAPQTALAVPFGLNMETAPSTAPTKPSLDRLELVFVGADWRRKGGDIALAVLDQLHAEGVSAHLTLVGGIPDHVKGHPNVTVAGFLDKSRPRDLIRLSEIYTRAHLMILPTRGDCTPMVIAEAMAHGTPVLVTETGGTPEMLGGSGAGQTLPMDANAQDWAKAIRSMTDTDWTYQFFADAAFDRAHARFSWDIWASDIARIIAEQQVALSRAA